MKNILIILMVVTLFCLNTVYAQESVEQYLLNLKEPKAEDYVKLLYEGSHENKLFAIIKLQELGARDQEVVDALIFGLQQGTLFVKREAGRVVNDYWDVRAASANALGNIGDPETLSYLHVSLRYDHDIHVKSSVAIAIGKIGQSESVTELARAIEISSTSGSDDVFIKACVVALGEIGDKEGFVPLVEIMRGKYRRDIKLTARESLKKIRW